VHRVFALSSLGGPAPPGTEVVAECRGLTIPQPFAGLSVPEVAVSLLPLPQSPLSPDGRGRRRSAGRPRPLAWSVVATWWQTLAAGTPTAATAGATASQASGRGRPALPRHDPAANGRRYTTARSRRPPAFGCDRGLQAENGDSRGSCRMQGTDDPAAVRGIVCPRSCRQHSATTSTVRCFRKMPYRGCMTSSTFSQGQSSPSPRWREPRAGQSLTARPPAPGHARRQ
jgi:hypothetical protein